MSASRQLPSRPERAAAAFAGALTPTPLLRAEGAVGLALAAAAYAALPLAGGAPAAALFGWGVFAAAFLLPDVAMFGYLAGPRAGAAAYNLVHAEVLPLALVGAGAAAARADLVAAALVWLAHIGFDRMLGYGLKHPSGFGDTHLGRVGAGRPRPPRARRPNPGAAPPAAA